MVQNLTNYVRCCVYVLVTSAVCHIKVSGKRKRRIEAPTSTYFKLCHRTPAFEQKRSQPLLDTTEETLFVNCIVVKV